MSSDPKEVAKAFIEAIPHCHALGMKLTFVGEGTAEIEMPYDPRFVGDPKTGVIHGGAVSALMDTCCGAAVLSHPSQPSSTATIDLIVTPACRLDSHHQVDLIGSAVVNRRCTFGTHGSTVEE